MRRRVVITGTGVISSMGHSAEVFAESLFARKRGFGRVDRLFGDGGGDDVPIFGAPVDDGGLPDCHAGSELGGYHRSLGFAYRAIDQIRRQSGDLDLGVAPLFSGVGIGQQLPELDELVDGAAKGWRASLSDFLQDVRAREQEERLCADAGSEWLRQRFGLLFSLSFAGACAASTQACIHAVEEVRAGLPLAIAGGHDSLLSSLGLYIMSELGTLAPPKSDAEPGIKPFDVGREGTLVGEGAAYFLFEERDHALARGAEIFAEVLGFGSSLDGYHITSPEPQGVAGARMIRIALDDAGIRPDEIQYVNAHGTGTLANDVVEAKILKDVFGAHKPIVSSSKSQFGHLIAACGAIELMACVAAVRHQRIPPNLGCQMLDPECDIRVASFGDTSAVIQNVLSNSFGFGGQNACIVLGSV